MKMFKNILILFFLLLFTKQLHSQSISINAGYPHYFMEYKKYSDLNSKVKNNFSYTVGISLNLAFKSSKIEFGIGYGTKNYSIYYDDISTEKSIIKNAFLYTPINFHQRIFTDTNNTLSFSIGIASLFPFKYNVNTIYHNGKEINNDDIYYTKIGNNLKLGFRYHRKLTDRFILFVELYSTYKFNQDHYSVGPSAIDDKEERFEAGINIGLEFLANKKELIFYLKKRKDETKN